MHAPISRRMLLLALASAISIPVTCEVVRGYYEFYTADRARDRDWFVNRSPQSAAAYAIALRYPRVLEQLPCYCGCMDFKYPHKHLLNCYLAPGGGFEEHGSLCRICQGEAFDAQQWHLEGLPIEEIRRRIDEKYQRVEPEFGPNAHPSAHRRPGLTLFGLRLSL